MAGMIELTKNVRMLGHDGVFIDGAIKVCVDPFQVGSFDRKADLILITHEHSDHCRMEDIERFRHEKTAIVASAAAARKIGKPAKAIAPGQTIEAQGILVSAVPAYNLDKFRAPGVPFHPRESQFVGFVFEINGVRYYHAGDTDFIPEMNELATRRIDVAFLPVSGTFVMTAEEAGAAADAIRPQVVVPMHYGSIVGSKADALDLQRFTRVPVAILEALS